MLYHHRGLVCQSCGRLYLLSSDESSL